MCRHAQPGETIMRVIWAPWRRRQGAAAPSQKCEHTKASGASAHDEYTSTSRVAAVPAAQMCLAKTLTYGNREVVPLLASGANGFSGGAFAVFPPSAASAAYPVYDNNHYTPVATPLPYLSCNGAFLRTAACVDTPELRTAWPSTYAPQVHSAGVSLPLVNHQRVSPRRAEPVRTERRRKMSHSTQVITTAAVAAAAASTPAQGHLMFVPGTFNMTDVAGIRYSAPTQADVQCARKAPISQDNRTVPGFAAVPLSGRDYPHARMHARCTVLYRHHPYAHARPVLEVQ